MVIDIGDGPDIPNDCHILVTTLNYFRDKVGGRNNKLDLKNIKLVIFDEAQEIF